ncbi:DUF4012 domain-containing protein [Bifidobacterium rousetti]|uniref:DUF4012 domain-containing protein n=1 Tax=Bifidobacterium rousetti TaxID=2045439 RepID=UPI001CC303A9|nr:DUF4012 domain-containing protein [Bifidobacterium rousetti]
MGGVDPMDGVRPAPESRPPRRRMSRASVARMKRGRRRRRIVLMTLVTVLVAFVAVVVWFAASAWIAKGEIEASVASANGIRDAVRDGDLESAADRIDDMSVHIGKAYAQTSQPVWSIAGITPYYGRDVTSVRETVHILEDIANNAMPALSRTARSIDPDAIGVKDGAISLGGLDAGVASDLARADHALTDAAARLADVPDTHFARVNDALAKGREQLAAIAGLTDTASRLADTLPAMLDLDISAAKSSGTSGTSRTYLLLAQNNAELRATGGIPASWGTLRVTRGRPTLGTLAPPPSDAAFSEDEALTVLTADERNLFSVKMATDYQDVNFTPDFPRAAELASGIWKRAGGGDVDGVISVDPVFLQRMLAITGPVTLADGTVLTGSDAASTLLNRTYLDKTTQAAQEAFFAMAAGQVFDHVLHGLGSGDSGSGDSDRLALLKTVSQAVEDGHLTVWSAHEDEQDRLAGTAVAGAMPSKPAEPVAGVYFNDATMGKMDWYLKRETKIAYDRTYPNGACQYTLTVTMTNTADPATIGKTPDLLRGFDADGKARHGEIETVLYVYAPAGGRLVDWSEDFDQIATHDGLTVGATTVTLEAGERFELTVHLLASPAAGDTPMTVRTTPDAG